MIKKISHIVILISLVISIPYCQVVTDDYSYSISVDKEFYQYGDTISVYIQMINTSNDTITIVNPCPFDWALLDSAGTCFDALIMIPVDHTYIIPPADSLMGGFEYPLNTIIVDNMSAGVYYWLMKPFYNYNINNYDTASFYYKGQLHVNYDESLPVTFNIGYPYPNPANPAVNFSFELDHTTFVSITVLDLSGREIVNLLSDVLPGGSHTIDWKMNDQVSGVYIVKYDWGDQVVTRKFSLVK